MVVLVSDSTIWRFDSGLESKAAKCLQLWKTACEIQSYTGAVAERQWPCKSKADFVEVVDRWQKFIVEAVDVTDVTIVRDTAI